MTIEIPKCVVPCVSRIVAFIIKNDNFICMFSLLSHLFTLRKKIRHNIKKTQYGRTVEYAKFGQKKLLSVHAKYLFDSGQ